MRKAEEKSVRCIKIVSTTFQLSAITNSSQTRAIEPFAPRTLRIHDPPGQNRHVRNRCIMVQNENVTVRKRLPCGSGIAPYHEDIITGSHFTMSSTYRLSEIQLKNCVIDNESLRFKTENISMF